MNEAGQPGELTLEELIEQISRYLEAYHGGSVELVSYAAGEVHVRLGGQCLGCPYMQATLALGIEKTIQHYFPEVRRVVAV